MVDTPAGLQSLCTRLAGARRIAVDTESNSLHAYRERVCLIQISLPDCDFLLDPLAMKDLSALAPFLADPEVEKVFHAAEYDLLCLRRDFGFRVRGLFDTHAAVRALGAKECGLAALLLREFGIQLDKRLQRADWGKRPLPTEALDYARMDTHFLAPLRDRIGAEVAARGLEAELREECERLEAIPDAVSEDPDPSPVWRIRGVHDLPPRARAILQALAEWREAEAARIDRPPFHVISEENLARLAQMAPSSEQELATAGLPHSVLRKHAAALLRAIADGRTRKPPSPPRSTFDDSARERLELLRDWRKRRAQARGVESDVILSRDTLFRLARRPPADLAALADVPGFGPWRRAQYGREILDLLHSPSP